MRKYNKKNNRNTADNFHEVENGRIRKSKEENVLERHE
jgi:hypothetical protein